MIFRTQKENIEIATCTELKQALGKLKSDVKVMCETVPFEEMYHLKLLNKKGSYKANSLVCPSLGLQVFENLVTDHPGSLISTLKTGHGTRNKISIDVDSVSGGPVYATRSNYKNLLDSKTYLRINNNVDLDLAVELCMRTKTQSGEAWNWERIGNEPKAKACYAKMTGYAVTQPGPLVQSDVSRLLSSLDGIAFFGQEGADLSYPDHTLGPGMASLSNHDDGTPQSSSVPNTPSVPSASSLSSTFTVKSALGYTMKILCPELDKIETIADVIEEFQFFCKNLIQPKSRKVSNDSASCRDNIHPVNT
ncbi:hypothetical protein QAD02_001936 [Eretmocerus hayati]|uniref:Uncharacterized protein n=1 Tax=Eretmocerus hayati TaxID=131215 RepID=A0ACC2NKB6_9HYME|nr:hypothetical protein QAD02_001936 [Eretmocerus hayati]